jgi:hypothetical protein
MKKMHYLFLLLVLFSLEGAFAQTSTSNDVTFVKDPVTNCGYRYNYYPNLEAYFDSKDNVYIYSQKGEWIRAAEIPSGYRGYSLNNKINVIITDYDEDDVIQFIKAHKKKYPYNFHPKSREISYND